EHPSRSGGQPRCLFHSELITHVITMLCARTDKRWLASTVTGMTVLNDEYTGHVDPGTAARRTLPGATIVKASVGPMDNNPYLITCSESGESLLSDAATAPAA